MKKYDYLIVGAGMFGCTFAQQAIEAGKSVLVVERRDHIGGNCFTYDDSETGINIHRYGSHIFHCNDRAVWDYINRFTEFNNYVHTVKTIHKNRTFSMPINLDTINKFFDTRFTPNSAKRFLGDITAMWQRRTYNNAEEKALSLIGKDLYEALIKEYTEKQWGTEVKNLPAALIARLPVRMNYNDRYFNDYYQGIPLEGYTPLFEKMLEGTDTYTGVDFFNEREDLEKMVNKIVYTGPVDKFFNYSEGFLNWRSLSFVKETINIQDYQGTSVMNYAEASVPYTRVHEFKHFHPERRISFSSNSTIIMREYSHVGVAEDPYYPVNTVEDRVMYEKYKVQCMQLPNVIFGGRLASYKYFDMNQVISQALSIAEQEFTK